MGCEETVLLLNAIGAIPGKCGGREIGKIFQQ